MATEQEGTAAAAQQLLGSLSLGESAERTDETKTNEDAAEENNAEAPTKACSACGTKSDALKKCKACKCVWYCDKDCQKKHRKEHKIECQRIKKILDQRGGRLDVGTELDVGPLGKLPPREECPICMRVMPIPLTLHRYSVCCGKTLCCGCSFKHHIQCEEQTCAFCRTAASKSDEEVLAPLRKRAELKDPIGLCKLALGYGYGKHGLSVDQAKCIELMRQSAGLGCLEAQYQLGSLYNSGEMGLKRDENEALKYWKKAAACGHLASLHDFGYTELNNDNYVAAMRHLRLSASGGYRDSMEALISGFECCLLRHADLAGTVQAFYLARAEMRSKDRDYYINHLKMTGKYKEEYGR
jgi:hypothetical protein